MTCLSEADKAASVSTMWEGLNPETETNMTCLSEVDKAANVSSMWEGLNPETETNMTCLSEADKAANVRRTSSYAEHVGGSACSQDGKREQSQVKHGARQMEADVRRDDDVLARSETSVHCQHA